MPAVVEELDAEVAVEREHPVAHLVNLMEQRAVVGTEREAHDGAEVDAALAGGYGGRRARHRSGEFAKQIGEFLGVFDGLGDAMTRQSSPRHGLLVLVVLRRELLHEAMNERRRVARIGLARADFLGREDVEEKRQVGRVGVRADSEVLGRTHRKSQLRVKVRPGRNGERVGFPRVRASIRREQCGDLVADTGRVGVGHEEPEVVAKVGKGRLLLQLKQHGPEHASAARIERVDGQGADVGVLHQVAPHARREVLAIDERTADGRLRQAERAADVADEAPRVLLVRRCE